MMGIDNFDAIINPPHGSILAVGKTQEVVCFDETKSYKENYNSINFIC